MKHYAIEVLFEEVFDQYVRDLWEQCHVNSLSSFMDQVVDDEIICKNMAEKLFRFKD